MLSEGCENHFSKLEHDCVQSSSNLDNHIGDEQQAIHITRIVQPFIPSEQGVHVHSGV